MSRKPSADAKSLAAKTSEGYKAPFSDVALKIFDERLRELTHAGAQEAIFVLIRRDYRRRARRGDPTVEDRERTLDHHAKNLGFSLEHVPGWLIFAEHCYFDRITPINQELRDMEYATRFEQWPNFDDYLALLVDSRRNRLPVKEDVKSRRNRWFIKRATAVLFFGFCFWLSFAHFSDRPAGREQVSSSPTEKSGNALVPPQDIHHPAQLNTVRPNGQELPNIVGLPAPPVGPKLGDAKFIPLFDGVNMAGWKVYSAPHVGSPWMIENGLITNDGQHAAALVFTKAKHQDFHLRAEIRPSEGKKSAAILFRHIDGDSGYAYRANIAGPYCLPGILMRVPNSLIGDLELLQTPDVEVSLKPGQWYVQEIIARGNQITVLVDGKQVVTYTEAGSIPRSGSPGLYVHGGAKVWLRKIEIRN